MQYSSLDIYVLFLAIWFGLKRDEKPCVGKNVMLFFFALEMAKVIAGLFS